MTHHREPETDRPPAWARRGRVRPYEIAIVLICVVVSVALGLHRKAERAGAPPVAVAQWPGR